MRYSVDRIEENTAVCEDENGNIIKIALFRLPKGIREGDIFVDDGDDFKIDLIASDTARDEMFDLQESIFKKKKKQ